MTGAMICRTCERALVGTPAGWVHATPVRHRTKPTYSPPGAPTWRLWRKNAEPGTRVRHVHTQATGTFVKASRSRHNGAIVDWDDRGFGVIRSNVVSASFDLEPID